LEQALIQPVPLGVARILSVTTASDLSDEKYAETGVLITNT
jgi:hypothetical protein